MHVETELASGLTLHGYIDRVDVAARGRSGSSTTSPAVAGRGVRGQGAVPDAVLRAGGLAYPRRDPGAAPADLPRQRRGSALRARRAALLATERKVAALWTAIERARPGTGCRASRHCAAGATIRRSARSGAARRPRFRSAGSLSAPLRAAATDPSDTVAGRPKPPPAVCRVGGEPRRGQYRWQATSTSPLRRSAGSSASWNTTRRTLERLDRVEALPGGFVRGLRAHSSSSVIMSAVCAVAGGRSVAGLDPLIQHVEVTEQLRSRSYFAGGSPASAPPAAPAGRETPSRSWRTPPGSAGGTSTRAAARPRPVSRRAAGRAARPARVGLRDRLQQRLRVRVLRVGEDLLGVPISTIRPRYMMAIRSQKNFALARSCVM